MTLYLQGGENLPLKALHKSLKAMLNGPERTSKIWTFFDSVTSLFNHI